MSFTVSKRVGFGWLVNFFLSAWNKYLPYVKHFKMGLGLTGGQISFHRNAMRGCSSVCMVIRHRSAISSIRTGLRFLSSLTPFFSIVRWASPKLENTSLARGWGSRAPITANVSPKAANQNTRYITINLSQRAYLRKLSIRSDLTPYINNYSKQVSKG